MRAQRSTGRDQDLLRGMKVLQVVRARNIETEPGGSCAQRPSGPEEQAVHAVRLHDGAGELLEGVGLLVRVLARSQRGDLLPW